MNMMKKAVVAITLFAFTAYGVSSAKEISRPVAVAGITGAAVGAIIGASATYYVCKDEGQGFIDFVKEHPYRFRAGLLAGIIIGGGAAGGGMYWWEEKKREKQRKADDSAKLSAQAIVGSSEHNPDPATTVPVLIDSCASSSVNPSSETPEQKKEREEYFKKLQLYHANEEREQAQKAYDQALAEFTKKDMDPKRQERVKQLQQIQSRLEKAKSDYIENWSELNNAEQNNEESNSDKQLEKLQAEYDTLRYELVAEDLENIQCVNAVFQRHDSQMITFQGNMRKGGLFVVNPKLFTTDKIS